MDKKIFWGKVENNKINFVAKNYNYIDNKEIFVLIDVMNDNDNCVQKTMELYKKYGEKFLAKIDDNISIYIYDKIKNITILARDRIGLKTVYYSKLRNGICFGRDLMDLVKAYNIKKEINTEVLSMYFRYLYINPPHTVFKDVYKLDNGEYLICKKGKIQCKKYWNLIEKYNENSKNKITDLEEAKNYVEDSIKKYIKNQLSKTEKFGVYMSGGIDSTTVAAICSKISNKKIDTFSIGFYVGEYNEAEDSRKIAEYIGTNHHELYIDKERMLQTIKSVPKYYTEPFCDASEVATTILNEYARENGVQYAFTGDGADQLFCGAGVYDFFWKYQTIDKIINPLKLRFSNRFIENSKLKYVYGNKKYQAQCDMINYEKYLDGLFVDNGCKRFEYENEIRSKNWQERKMIIDLNSFISDRVNTKIERASSRNGIDIKSPFLSTELIERSFRIPHKYKYYKRIKKYILKEILFKYVPREYFSAKKRGFSIPTKEWLKSYLYDDLQRVSTKEYIEKQNIFNYDALHKLIGNIDDNNATQAIWNFYMFQLWYDEYMK